MLLWKQSLYKHSRNVLCWCYCHVGNLQKMNSSKEELIELADFTSPTKSSNRTKKNKIDTSPTNSVSTTSRGDIVNIFSVKNTSSKLHSTLKNSDSVSQSLSDISGGTFIVEKVEDNKNVSARSYKDKISKHLKNIKQRASTSHKLRTYKGSKSDFPIEKIRRENEDIDADIQSVKDKFKRNRKFVAEKRKFFFGVGDETKDNDAIDKNEAGSSEEIAVKPIRYSLPTQLQLDIELSEKENCFVPNGKSIEINKKINEQRNSLEETVKPRVAKRNINLLEQRLLSIDDKKWFNNAGELTFLERPLSKNSIRPFKVKYNDRQLQSYQPAITQEECNEIIIIKENILELHLNSLQYTFHPLFSIEHYFVQKLKDLHEQYTNNNENNNLKKIKSQLDDLRKSRDVDLSNDGSHTKKIIKINKEIKTIRNFYFEEAKKNRDNLKCILETWKTIKKIRENQNYSSTNMKLIIKKERSEIDSENDEYKNNFDEILSEILEEKRTDHDKTNKNSDENDNSESEPSSSKNLPLDIDEDRLRSELQKKFQRCFKPPGEPVLKLILSKDNEVTKDIENNKEILRRNAVSSTRIYFKISCGKIEVCKSTPMSLNENFCLDIEEAFSIQLVDIPEFLTIEIFEQHKGLLKKKICEMEIKIPQRNISVKNSKLHKAAFEKNEIVHYKHEGIGSGVNLKTTVENKNLTPVKENPDLYTAGYLQYYIGWEKVYREINEDCLESQIKLINDIIDKNMMIDSSKLEEWLKQIPGLNLEGDIFTQFGDGYDQSVRKNKSKYFRLNPYATNTKFCDISEIDQNIRLQILQLRNHHEVEFDGMIVPNRVKEIPYNLLADYKRRIATESEGLWEEDEDENEIETQRSYGKKYLKQVHIKIFQKCKNSDNNLAYESVVNEKYLIYFELMVKTLMKNFLNWFRWRPKINQPLPIKAKEHDHGEDYKIKNQVNIIIKINNGRNVPNRSMYTHNIQDSESNLKLEGDIENDVRPFVEVSYGNISVRTSTSKGVNPVWNETLTLPLESLHSDYLNPSSLNGNIIVNLYDERESAIRNINRKSFTWLGGMDILLSAICYSSVMEGSFKIKLPQVLFGYETELEKHKTKSPKISNLQSNLLHTFLQMEFKLEPNIPKLSPNMEELSCSEAPYLQEYILKWNHAYNNSYPNRKFSVFAIDTNARTVCITRYLKPLEPPQISLEEFDITAEQCLRYISLIPFTECNEFYQSVWLSTDQLLRFMLGSITDHAITLTCYLLALKLEVWLLLGYGIPHGSTAYVLTCEYTKEAEAPIYYIYDVVYNEKYNVMDSCCPLRKIYCLVNGDNVWANTQRNDNVILTRFDLTKRSDWLPLFTNNVSAPTNFINNKVIYQLCNNIEDLEIQLERKIRKKVAKLRQLDRTIWNNNLGNTFKNILKSFEINCMYNKNHFETSTEVNKELSSYYVTGYIMNIPFTNTSTIVRKIKSLGIHVQEDRNIEFALAIHIPRYPGQLLSVWVLLVNVKQKNII